MDRGRRMAQCAREALPAASWGRARAFPGKTGLFGQKQCKPPVTVRAGWPTFQETGSFARQNGARPRGRRFPIDVYRREWSCTALSFVVWRMGGGPKNTHRESSYPTQANKRLAWATHPLWLVEFLKSGQKKNGRIVGRPFLRNFATERSDYRYELEITTSRLSGVAMGSLLTVPGVKRY